MKRFFFDSAYVRHMIKPNQVFVNSFLGHRLTIPSLAKIEVVDVDPGAYSDGQGNLVIPAFSDFVYVSSLGALGDVTGQYEITDDPLFTSQVSSGALHLTNPTSVPVGLVGPFYVRILCKTFLFGHRDF